MSRQRLDAWDQLDKGTLCRVEGREHRPFAFQYATVDPDTGTVEITLYGPKQRDGRNHDGHMAFVSCPAERVSPWGQAHTRRGRGA